MSVKGAKAIWLKHDYCAFELSIPHAVAFYFEEQILVVAVTNNAPSAEARDWIRGKLELSREDAFWTPTATPCYGNDPKSGRKIEGHFFASSSKHVPQALNLLVQQPAH